jgi:hypothetical protein
MHTTQDYKINKNVLPIWDCIAEYIVTDSVKDEFLEAMRTDRSLPQTLRELGLPTGYISKILASIEEIVHGLNSYLAYGPLRMRLFCQREVIQELRAQHFPNQMTTGQPQELSRQFHDLDIKNNWGWGCFVVEKRGDFQAASQDEASYIAELYLYREGNS